MIPTCEPGFDSTSCVASRFTILAFYSFSPLHDKGEEFQDTLKEKCKELQIKGTILFNSEEGINGTIAGSLSGVNEIIELIRSFGFKELECKSSWSNSAPFQKMKVKSRDEIVRLKQEFKSANYIKSVEPQEWDEIISDPEVTLIDVRNFYETKIGKFRNSIDPNTENFRDFPAWFEKWMENREAPKRIAIYCTGGIRCEKLDGYLYSQFNKGANSFSPEVYQLKGGVLNYILKTGNSRGNWEGNCFVFDDRVAVDGCTLAPIELKCEACDQALASKDRVSLTKGKIFCTSCRALTKKED